MENMEKSFPGVKALDNVNFYLKNNACIIDENIGETFRKTAKGYEMELNI